jgi:hypothetical protein
VGRACPGLGSENISVTRSSQFLSLNAPSHASEEGLALRTRKRLMTQTALPQRAGDWRDQQEGASLHQQLAGFLFAPVFHPGLGSMGCTSSPTSDPLWTPPLTHPACFTNVLGASRSPQADNQNSPSHSYSGGRDQEDLCSSPAWAKSYQDPTSINKLDLVACTCHPSYIEGICER